ncbi:hypothetical protein ACSBOB_16295 [Mesorhizobium sp. ASY16-5R]|uniref:hypothetical protein n=1 Tax=Mesorhizobium sp. ASY16-5R TaxID=3445772 RepID=UPI003FA1356B
MAIIHKMYLSTGVLALLALAGCQGSPGTKASAATGQIVSAGQMPDFCRSQFANQTGVTLGEISTDNPVVAASGTTIRGSWTLPNDDDTAGTFLCRFGPNGAFQGVNQI